MGLIKIKFLLLIHSWIALIFSWNLCYGNIITFKPFGVLLFSH